MYNIKNYGKTSAFKPKADRGKFFTLFDFLKLFQDVEITSVERTDDGFIRIYFIDKNIIKRHIEIFEDNSFHMLKAHKIHKKTKKIYKLYYTPINGYRVGYRGGDKYYIHSRQI